MSKFLRPVLNLLFPPLCLHCTATLADCRMLLCSHCISLLDLLNPQERCPYCFTPIEEGHTICARCLEKKTFLHMTHKASAFEHQGPAATLMRHFKYANAPYLAKDLAAWMVVQLSHLNWPIPDLITAVPQSTLHRFRRGYNQSALLAQEIAHFLNRPFHPLLIKKSGHFSQSGLSKEQRLQLPSETLSWKHADATSMVIDKNIFLIDDVMTTGTTLNHCASLIYEGMPKKIYCLTFCFA